jgi:hypothetical protein
MMVYQVTVVYQVYQVYLEDGATGYAFGVMEANAVGENARSHQIECGQDVTRVVRRVTASQPCAWMRSSPR